VIAPISIISEKEEFLQRWNIISCYCNNSKIQKAHWSCKRCKIVCKRRTSIIQSTN